MKVPTVLLEKFERDVERLPELTPGFTGKISLTMELHCSNGIPSTVKTDFTMNGFFAEASRT